MAKIDNPIKLYDIVRSYSQLPSSRDAQRTIVETFYDQVNAPGGRVTTGSANEGRIYHVAKNIYEKAHKTYAGLTRQEVTILEGLVKIHAARNVDERDARFERLCIQIQDYDNSEISDRVEKAAEQVLGHGLRIKP